MAEDTRVLVLTRDEIESILRLEDSIEVVEQGFKEYNSGRTVIPFPVAQLIPDHNGDIHIKPGYIRGYPTYTVKIASGFYNNPREGLPPSNGMMLLFDSGTGTPLCFEMDRGFMTDLRTAAAGAVAARVLAKSKIGQVGILGTGTQARLQAEALSKVRDFPVLKVWGRTPARVEEFVKIVQSRIPAKVVPAKDAEDAVVGSDVVVTATMSTIPLVRAKWISEGAHITAVGSDSPEKQELEAKVLGKADKVIVDSLRQCAQLGELHHAIDEGILAENDVHAELGEVLLGKKTGRESDDEITVCDLTGLAVQDVVTSQMVYERALKNKMGKYVQV